MISLLRWNITYYPKNTRTTIGRVIAERSVEIFGEETEGSCGWECLDKRTNKNDFNREVKRAGNKISDGWGDDKLEPSDKGEAPFFQSILKMSTRKHITDTN